LCVNRPGFTDLGVDLTQGVIGVSQVSILVAEDNELWRNFIGLTLRIESSFEIICEAVDGVEAVLVAERRQPTIALLDLGLPRLNGLDAARSIRELAPYTKIVFLSDHRDVEVVKTALTVGSGYVLKPDAGDDLLTAIHSAVRGERFLSRQLAGLGITLDPEEK
jgi:DNA-binding NarL/FixJ family response regulator